MAEPTAELPYRIGLPAWGFPGWQGRYFRSDQPALADYAQVFNTVEGNTTFYRVPDQKTVARWLDAVEEQDFKFCWKLPREVTHEARPDLDLLNQFLSRMAPLAPHSGPLLVQFPDKTGPDELDKVRRILEALPADRRHAIELRHPAFFSTPELMTELIDEFDLGWVCMDTRPLFQGDLDHPEVRSARHEKPQVPVLPPLKNGLEFIRLVLHPDRSSNTRWVAAAAERAAEALRSGEELYVMIHCPNNQHCPDLALEFHQALSSKVNRSEWPPLAPWPVPQQSLF